MHIYTISKLEVNELYTFSLGAKYIHILFSNEITKESKKQYVINHYSNYALLKINLKMGWRGRERR